MARLYICNATGQNRIVNYRLDYTVDDMGRRTSERLVPYKSQLIPARAQVQFGGDFHPMQISDIVQQLELNCGAVHVDAIRTAKKIGVVKLIWSQDRSISKAVCVDVIDHNMGLLTDQGAERRQRLALVIDQQLTNLIEKTPPKLEVEFESVGEDSEFHEALAEGIRVNHATKAPPPPTKKRAASRRSA